MLHVLVHVVQDQPVAEGGVERAEAVAQRVALQVALDVLQSGTLMLYCTGNSMSCKMSTM